MVAVVPLMCTQPCVSSAVLTHGPSCVTSGIDHYHYYLCALVYQSYWCTHVQAWDDRIDTSFSPTISLSCSISCERTHTSSLHCDTNGWFLFVGTTLISLADNMCDIIGFSTDKQKCDMIVDVLRKRPSRESTEDNEEKKAKRTKGGEPKTKQK